MFLKGSPKIAKMGSQFGELQTAVRNLKARMKVVEKELKEVPLNVPILEGAGFDMNQSWREICRY